MPVKNTDKLINYYLDAWQARYGDRIVVNRENAHWKFKAILMDLSMDETKSLIDYFFTTDQSNRHEITGFFSNYHKLIEAKATSDEDAARRERLRQESKERAREWNERRGNTGTFNN